MAGAARPDVDLVLGVRPEAVLVSREAAAGHVPVEAHIIEPLGAYDIVDLRIGNEFLRARTASGFVGKPGDTVWAKLDENQTHFFEFQKRRRHQCEARRVEMAQIKLDRVTKTFGGATALRDLSLDIADGEFFVLLGPTGAGKTTTLRLIAGLEKPTSGAISIGGEDVRDWSAAERDVALVFQYYSLYPRYTVRQNLAFPLKSRVRNYSAAEIEERVAEGGAYAQDRPPPRPQDRQALRRRDAARLDRPRHRARAEGVPDGRAAFQSRRQAQGGAAVRIEGPADEARRDLRLRHPRPDRGDVDGRQGRRAERRTRRAGRQAAGNLQRAARRLRRRLRRLAGDEPARRRASRRARLGDVGQGRGSARGRRPPRAPIAARSPSAFAPRMFSSAPARRSRRAFTMSRTTAWRRS